MQNFIDSLTLADIGGILLGLAAIITAVVGGRKSKTDALHAQAAAKTDASSAQAAAVKAYAEAARIASDQNCQLQDMINRLEKKVDELLRVIRRKEVRIHELETQTRIQQDEIDTLQAEVVQLRKSASKQDEIDDLRTENVQLREDAPDDRKKLPK